MDGWKAKVDISPQEWLNNPHLDFANKRVMQTQKGIRYQWEAKYKGQILTLFGAENFANCSIRGSLATFFNEGRDNYFDYSYQNFLDTLPLLENELGITPEKVLFSNVEFAVMFESPIVSNDLFESIKFHKKGAITNIVIERKKVGIRIEHQRYVLKLYDKGLQCTGKPSNIIKFEVVIKKMIEVAKFGLKTLSDLKNPLVWLHLSKMLIRCWNELIIVDKSLNYKAMKNFEQKKYLLFQDANYWSGLKLTERPSNSLNKLYHNYAKTPNLKDTINNLIVEKCIQNVTANCHEIVCQLTDFQKPISKQNQKQKVSPINSYDKELTQSQSHTQKQEKKVSSNKVDIKNKKCKCRDCRKTLRNKKSTALFCSNACRQKFHNHKKKIEIGKERQELEKIIKRKKPIRKLLLGLFSNSGVLEYKKYDEVNVCSDEINRLKEVYLVKNPKAKPQRLTNERARRLVRYFSSGKNFYDTQP